MEQEGALGVKDEETLRVVSEVGFRLGEKDKARARRGRVILSLLSTGADAYAPAALAGKPAMAIVVERSEV